MSRKSRDKGKRFERDIVKKFSKWSKNTPPFKRNWGVSSQRKGIIRGDIVPDYDVVSADDHPLVLVIELKNVEGWELSKLFTNECALIAKYWEQSIEEASELYPILILKKNYHQPLCFLTKDLLSSCGVSENTFNVILRWNGVLVVLLDDFFSNFQYSKIESLRRENSGNCKRGR